MTKEIEKKKEAMLKVAEIFYEVLVDGIEKGMLNEKDFFISEEKGSEVRSAAHTEETEEESQKEADKEEAAEVAEYLSLTDSKPSKTQRKYKISGKPCKYCTGLISWDEYDHTKKTGKAVHVDGDGYIIGNGSCPNWRD